MFGGREGRVRAYVVRGGHGKKGRKGDSNIYKEKGNSRQGRSDSVAVRSMRGLGLRGKGIWQALVSSIISRMAFSLFLVRWCPGPAGVDPGCSAGRLACHPGLATPPRLICSITTPGSCTLAGIASAQFCSIRSLWHCFVRSIAQHTVDGWRATTRLMTTILIHYD